MKSVDEIKKEIELYAWEIADGEDAERQNYVTGYVDAL